MTIVISEETGLPEVPKGFFWRVTDVQGTFVKHDVVELRRKMWVGSYVVVREHIGGTATRENVLKTAIDAMRKLGRRGESKNNPLKGDYPPKRLS